MTQLNPVHIHHKSNPGFGLFVAILVFVSCGVVAWLAFHFSRDFLNSADAVARKMPYVFSGIFLLIGIWVAIIFIRQEFDERISIDSLQVKYTKSGRLRRTVSWTESADNYKVIEESEEEAVEEMRNLTLKLKHSRNPERDVLLEKNLPNEKERMEKRTYYKRLFKLDR